MTMLRCSYERACTVQKNMSVVVEKMDECTVMEVWRALATRLLALASLSLFFVASVQWSGKREKRGEVRGKKESEGAHWSPLCFGV